MPRSKKNKRSPFAWKQPCCGECWAGLVHKTGHEDLNMTGEVCCFCKSDIGDGYAIRINPGTTPYPTLRKEEEAD